jgi:hypothetical protein
MFRRLWKLFLANLRLDPAAVCEMSAPLGAIDYHDYTDTREGYPDHFGVLTCVRCGKQFRI